MTADDLHAGRPKWVSRSLTLEDTRFLSDMACQSGAKLAVEVGTGSGFSAAVIAHALPGASLYTYDASRRFYANRRKPTGEAAREMLPINLLRRITFHNPACSLNARWHKGVDFLFIDANHRHPWPTLDLLAVLDSLSSGATVVLHDINLPTEKPNHPIYGAKWLFDSLGVVRFTPPRPHANIGSFMAPEDKKAFRKQLIRIVSAYSWETRITEDYSALL